MPAKKLKFKQIAVGQYRAKDGSLSFNPIGLSTEGKVYKFLLETGWTDLEDAARWARENRDDVGMLDEEFH